MISKPLSAMVLAAGMGKRLRPLTTYVAKPAMSLLGRPLIEYTFRRLVREGVREVVVNLHHRPETLEPSLDRASEELHLHRSFEPTLLGTAGGLKKVEKLLRGGTFLLVNGDTLVDLDLARLEEVHRSRKATATLLLRPKPAGTSYSGIVLREDHRIAGMERKDSTSDLMFAGIWLLEASVLDRLSGEPRGLEEELLPRLIEEGSAYGSVQDGAWVTIDTARRYWEASLLLARDGLFEQDWLVRSRPIEVVDGTPARVLTGPETRVDEAVRFRGSVILGSRCHVARGARLENVVCWDDVTIPSGARIANSVLTHGVALPQEAELDDKVVLKLGSDRSELRRREIQDGLVVAELKSGRAASL